MRIVPLAATLVLALAPAVHAKDTAKAPAKTESKADTKADTKADEKRAKIDASSKAALDRVLGASPEAKKLFEKAAGYAAFDNTKFALGVSGGGGSGVAVDKASGKKTYMKMATVGVGFGLGGQSYQVVFLFETKAALDNFVDNGWQADTNATAAAGKSGANAESTFSNGVAYFMMTKKGLMANAGIAGTKYRKAEDLN